MLYLLSKIHEYKLWDIRFCPLLCTSRCADVAESVELVDLRVSIERSARLIRFRTAFPNKLQSLFFLKERYSRVVGL